MTIRIVFCLLTLPFIATAISRPAAAQGVVDRIAYDQCGPDLDTWGIGCDIHALVDGSDTLVAYGGVGPKWSPDGSRIAFMGSGYDNLFEILVANLADGSVANLTNHPAYDGTPAWSRNGRIAFVSDRDGSAELYVMDADGTNLTRLTYNTGFRGVFGWSSDGGRIAFSSDRDGAPELYVMGADGSNPTRLSYSMGFKETFVWSPDDGRIAFICEFESSTWDICTIDADGANFVRLMTDSSDGGAAFSLVDGRLTFTAGGIPIVDSDGTITRVGTARRRLALSPDGGRLAYVGTTSTWFGRCYFDEGAHNADDFCMLVPDIYIINRDGSGLSRIASGDGIDWFTPPPGQPVATFTYHCSGSACDFDGSGSLGSGATLTSYVWQFGDGTSGSGATASHTYSHGQPYTVTLTVTNDTGATGSLSMGIYANAAPIASFTVACIELTCSVDGSGSSDPDGRIEAYAFLFGDGQYAYGPTVTHTYATPGAFTVTLRVWDDSRYLSMGTLQKIVSVGNVPPVALFTPSCVGLTCNFDGSASSDPDGAVTSHSWSFGDGTIGSGATASHTYAAAGTYIVTLMATDDDDATDARSETVSVAALAPVDPAVQQIAMLKFFECEGAHAPEDPPCQRSVLTDIDGSHVIPIPPGYTRAWSPDGTTLLWDAGDIFVQSFMGGTSTNLTNHPAHYWWPAWSPDGTRIAFASDRDGPRDLYVMNADGSGIVRISTGVGMALQDLLEPAWSPDSTRIAFASDRDGPLDLYVTNADGSGVVRIGTGVGMAWQPTWSPDSRRLAFACIVAQVPSPWWAGNHDVCAINADGSGFARLTGGLGNDYSPDWSPDGARILFLTDRYGGLELVVMNPQGADVTRISPGILASDPSWSSDGTRIAFVYLLPYNPDEPWMPWSFVFVGNADGTGVTDLGWGIDPIWRPLPPGLNDRPVALFTYECSGRTCTFDGLPSSDFDGTIANYWWQFGDGATAAGATATHTFAGGHDVRLIVMDDRSALGTSIRNVNQPPVVSFTTNCIGLTCTFDRSASSDPDGEIAYFRWRFGDGTDTSGSATLTHTFAAGGTYIVTLTATDQDYGEGTQSKTITVVKPNVPPVASSAFTCSGLTCNFNAAGSSDPDGSIASYAWNFGDGTTGSGVTASHTYAAGGTYTVTLSVTDNRGATTPKGQSVTVAPSEIHVGDLDRARTIQSNNWTAIVTITVHDANHGLVAAATVTGRWNNGSVVSCTTTAGGQCAVSRSGILKTKTSVSFTVTNVARAPFVYKPTGNHDPDGDSNGITVTVTRQ